MNDATLSQRQSSCMCSQQNSNPWEQDAAQNGNRMCHSKAKHLKRIGFISDENICRATVFDDAFLYPSLQQQHYYSFGVSTSMIHSRLVANKSAG